ncbi:ATP-binding protein [Alphaproteobacteria bacterium]|nr:ATP-binding protein [Alphaproteobacteria bacterium]
MMLLSLKNKIGSSFQNFTFFFIFLTSLILSFTIFLSLSGNFSNLEQVQEISKLISANYILIVGLILISINKIYKIFKEKQFKSKFRVQFTSLFIIISFIPTTLITLFSLIFFDQGVKIWFNEKLEKVIYESKQISESYFNEHKKNIKNDILFINDEFTNEKVFYFTDKLKITEYLSYFLEVRNLDEAVIFESSGQLLAKVGSFLVESENRPPLWTFLIADDGEIAIFPNSDQTKVRALIRLQRAIPTYLYIGKSIDANVLSRVESVNQTADEYVNITQRLNNFQFQFNKLFLAINFLMILLSTWFGLRFSNKILNPIMSIILDSQKIINDNFRSRITVIKGKNEFNFLSKLLNQILNSLAIQKNKLIKAKETINLRRKFTEKIINEVSNGIIYLDTNEKVLLYNRRSQEIFGKNFKEGFFKKNSQISQFIRKFKEDDTFLNEIQLKYVSQKKIKILNFKLSKVFEKKKFKGMILSINDITELVSAQKNAAWSNVARYMAHEIKNPLTPIKLSAQRISHSFQKNKLNESSSLKSCTETIIRQVSNIEKLVSEFSNFARMPEGNFEPIKLNNLIETQLNTQKIVNNDVNFKLISNNKQIEILCDYDQISRLFMNILKNSVESSTKKKKEVLVSLNKKGKFVIIDIEDNGDGFEENNRENFFEPYMTKKINGTGLGLAICKKIVEDHNGQIELLDSKLLGGAMVRIKLFTKMK